MKKIFLYAIILSECILGITILFFIFQIAHKKNILGASATISIPKKGVIQNSDSKLHNYFEPKPGTLQKEEQPQWFKRNPLTPIPDWVTTPLRYSINADTLNEIKDYAENKPPHTYRIAVLGDSFTFGLFVNSDQTFAKQIEKMLNNKPFCSSIQKYEVINLGVAGYDIDYSVERFRLRGQKYNPDLVIWFLKNDDFDGTLNDIAFDLMDTHLARYKTEDEKFKNLDNVWEKVKNDIMTQYGEKGLIQYYLAAMKNLRLYYNGPLIIYSISPLLKPIHINGADVIRTYVSTDNQARFFYNQTSDYEKFSRFPDGHPDAVGHLQIAEDLFNYLTQDDSLCPTTGD